MVLGISEHSVGFEFRGEIGEPSLELPQGLSSFHPLVGAEGTRLAKSDARVDRVGPGRQKVGQCSPTRVSPPGSGASGRCPFA